MLLTAGRLIEFTRFLQIFCWIFLPTLLVAVLITTWHDRRRRKRNREKGEKETIDFLLSPESSDEGSYVLFDHSNLIRNYRDQLSYNHARYTALLQDFKKLEMKQLKNNHMENLTEQTPIGITEQQAIHFLQNQLEQRIHLQSELEQLKQSHVSKSDHITWLETVIGETRQQNQVLEARIGDQQDLVANLQEKLALEEARTAHAEQRLARNTRLLQRLHRVMAACISAEADETQVIELKPVYLNNEEHNWAEQAL